MSNSNEFNDRLYVIHKNFKIEGVYYSEKLAIKNLPSGFEIMEIGS